MVYTCSLSFLKNRRYTFHLVVDAKERIPTLTVDIATVGCAATTVSSYSKRKDSYRLRITSSKLVGILYIHKHTLASFLTKG